MSTVLGLAWGLTLAWPLASRARGAAVARRLPAPPRPSRRNRALEAIRRTPVVRVVPSVLDRRRATRCRRRLAAELPVVTDLLSVAVGAGANPTHAVALAAHWSPRRAARVLRRVVDAQARGADLTEALRVATAGVPDWAPIVDALLASERLGAPIGPSLARVADQQRAELRRRAEAHARRVPVQLLFPLVFLVLPAFGLLTVVPVLVSGLTSL